MRNILFAAVVGSFFTLVGCGGGGGGSSNSGSPTPPPPTTTVKDFTVSVSNLSVTRVSNEDPVEISLAGLEQDGSLTISN